MRSSPFPLAPSCPLALCGLAACTCAASATDVVIYGGPTYNSITGTGYQSPFLPVAPGATAGNAVGVGSASRFVSGAFRGSRPVRWDSSGAAAVELGNLGVGSGSVTNCTVLALNPGGVAVGDAEKYVSGSNRGLRAVRWDAAGTAATELDNLGVDPGGFSDAHAAAINGSGLSVGWADKYISGSNMGPRAVRWAALGTAATELGHLGTDAGGLTTCNAYAVNSAGTAIGAASKYASGNPVGFRAVRWDAAGTAATELGHLGTESSGNTESAASAINDAGTAVGYAFKYDGDTWLGVRAVRWNAGGTTATELGTLGTDADGSTQCFAVSINSGGTAAGYAYKHVAGVNVGARAVRWSASGTAATELGALGTDASGNSQSRANAINAVGTAVGFAELYDAAGEFLGQRAVIWKQDGAAVTLNSMLSPADAARWNLTEARGISDTNWVTGIGAFDPDGPGPLPPYDRMFLLQLPATPCAADFDGNGIIQPADVGAFVTQWFAALTSGC